MSPPGWVKQGQFIMDHLTYPLIPVDEFLADTSYKEQHNKSRWVLFKMKGIVCVTCGLAGTHAAFWRENKQRGGHHCDLVAATTDSHGNVVYMLMTKDHIVPRARGGANEIYNMQPMCSKCNNSKGHKYSGPVTPDMEKRVAHMKGRKLARLVGDNEKAMQLLASYPDVVIHLNEKTNRVENIMVPPDSPAHLFLQKFKGTADESLL